MTITDALRQRVIDTAGNRCGYCQVDARFIYAPIEVDHIIPVAQGGTDEESNLWLACPRCNNYKRDQITSRDPESNKNVSLFNPRTQLWQDHFSWDEDDPALIVGNSATGRATVVALRLNSESNLAFRRLLVSVRWYPPND